MKVYCSLMMKYQRKVPSSAGLTSINHWMTYASKVLSIRHLTSEATKTYLVNHPYQLPPNPALVTNKEQGEEFIIDPLAESGAIFAIVEFSGTQFKVVQDDVVTADLIDGADIGDIITIDKVMMIGSKKATVIGCPYVEFSNVQAAVEEITKDKKVITLKFRRRKNSKRIKGFRRQLTILRIKDIIIPDKVKDQLT